MSESDGDRGKGPQLSAAAEALRNSAIMAQLHAGDKVADVAAAHKLTTRQISRIAKAFKIRRTALEDRPMEIVERALREMEERMRNLALLAAENAESMPAVALGALKAAADQHERYLELLSQIGKLPDDLEVFRTQADLERLAWRVFEMIDEWAAGRATVEDVKVAADLMTGVSREPADAESTAVDLPEIGEGDDG